VCLWTSHYKKLGMSKDNPIEVAGKDGSKNEPPQRPTRPASRPRLWTNGGFAKSGREFGAADDQAASAAEKGAGLATGLITMSRENLYLIRP
jgi:hypothetical protein